MNNTLKPVEDIGKEYDKAIDNAIKKLDEAEDAVRDMIEVCAFGEPELFGEKSIRLHYENLADQMLACSSYLHKKKLGWMSND